MATLQELSEAIQKGSAPRAKALTTALLAAKVGAGEVLIAAEKLKAFAS